MPKPRLAVFAGPTATVLNTEPLVTSQKARLKYGLPLRKNAYGEVLPRDVLRPQRLARPVTVYVEAFSAHPLERDAQDLYAPPDGYLDATGTFHRERLGPDDIPVYEVTLSPEDGLYPLPYMARRQDGSAFEGDDGRQPFFPDASRLFEEIDRLGIGPDGVGSLLAGMADYDFYRVLPSGGYRRGQPEEARTDVGVGPIAAERAGLEFFPYRPDHAEPTLAHLALATNKVMDVLSRGDYLGALWLEGSPHLEETLYWFQLLLDVTVPVVGVAAQRRHGALGAEGDRNVVDAVSYVVSRIWQDEQGRDRVGPVVVADQRIFSAREVHKVDARPGGFAAGGGHGGVVGSVDLGRVALTFLPTARHTWRSDVRLSRLPETVPLPDGRRIRVRDDSGHLLPEAMPEVTILKFTRYPPSAQAPGGQDAELVDSLLARTRAEGRLVGFVVEGSTPYGGASPALEEALRQAERAGAPVVRVGRGDPEGFTPEAGRVGISGRNLSAVKARLLLTAALLAFGALPATEAQPQVNRAYEPFRRLFQRH